MSSVLESVKCPVCYELFPGNVFQCSRGHSICQLCYSEVENCPQCRIPYGEDPIRNRAMEDLLKELREAEQVPCPFWCNGCENTLDTKSIQDHADKCHYNICVFGPLVAVCKYKGNPDCTFHMNAGNIREAIDHFCKKHGAKIKESLECSSFLPNLENISFGTFADIIMTQEEKGFAVLCKFLLQDSNLLMVAYTLDYSLPGKRLPKCKVQFQFTAKESDRNGHNEVSVSITPLNILKVENFNFERYRCQLPIEHLKTVEGKVPFKINVKI